MSIHRFSHRQGIQFTRRDLLRQMGAAGLVLSAEGPRALGATILSNAAEAPATPCLFYRPANAWVGDTIPFCKDGVYHIFYLHDWRDEKNHGPGTSWYQVSTKDFIHFQDHGEMLPRGTAQDQDLSVATGSVLEARGQYHAFYTGYSRVRKAQGQPEQSICHAISDDLVHWKKLPDRTFYADTKFYEKDDWRDPFVFWNEQASEYWLLCAARLKAGPFRRRGCTALCTSKDLITWNVKEPVYAPNLYETHECPDLFRMGDWWYLIFSEFSDASITRYRMGRSINGPWITPEDDAFDGRDFYAAKTAGDGVHRFLFGWNPTRNENKDYAFWNWGGNLGVHQLIQRREGTLGVTMPETLHNLFRTAVPQQDSVRVGRVHEQVGAFRLDARESFAPVGFGDLPPRCRIEATIIFRPSTRRCGLMLHSDLELSSAYSFRIDPERARIVLESYPRPDANSPYMMGLERPLHVKANTPIKLNLLIDGDICTAYLDGFLALSTRMDNPRGGRWGPFVEDGDATFSALQLLI